jgi:hypothetical protein
MQRVPESEVIWTNRRMARPIVTSKRTSFSPTRTNLPTGSEVSAGLVGIRMVYLSEAGARMIQRSLWSSINRAEAGTVAKSVDIPLDRYIL